MPNFSTGVVTAILSERTGLQRVEVDGRRAYVLTQLVGGVAVGDRVVVNTTAVDLGLGTGGWDVVHWNLARESLSQAGAGGIMKLRYTSLQVDTGAAEEDLPFGPAGCLDGMPVVACVLHSQLACVAVVLQSLAPHARAVYVMTDSAALPLALSDLVARLCDRGLLRGTVTCGQAFGGDVEAVNLHSALDLARSSLGADVVVVGPGPGVVGTHSALGFSGLEVAGVVDATTALGGRALVAPRYSSAEPRPRHQGVSHHTLTALRLVQGTAWAAIPGGEPVPGLPPSVHILEVEVPDVAALLADQGLEVTTMGRGPDDDPGFFRYAGAAGAAVPLFLAG